MPTNNLVRDLDGTTATVETRKQTPTGAALNVQIGPGDVVSNIPVMMDFEHHQLHEGELFKAENAQASLGTTTVKYGFTVPVFANTIQGPHLVVGVDIYNGAALVQIYEGATFTSGSAMTAYNRNRNSAGAPTATVKSGVTSTTGTLIDSFYVGAGNRSAGSSRAAAEWILKSDTIYRIDVIGKAAGTEAIIAFNWYEDLGV